MDLNYDSPPDRKWSDFAILSLIHAGVGLLILPLAHWLMDSTPSIGLMVTAPVILFWPPSGAIVLGIAALIDIAKSRGQLKGLPMAMVGLMAGLAWPPLITFIWVLSHPSGSVLK